MATWQPKSDEAIGKSESLGRRLFDEPMLAGVQNSKPFGGLDLRNFQEKRDREFSLDRLGLTGIDKKVLNYLLPRARAASTKFKAPKSFDGWVVLRADVVVKPPVGSGFPVHPSPIAGDGLDENKFHAHALLPESAEPDDRYRTALHLRHIFGTYGTIHQVASDSKRSADSTSRRPANVLADVLDKLHSTAAWKFVRGLLDKLRATRP